MQLKVINRIHNLRLTNKCSWEPNPPLTCILRVGLFLILSKSLVNSLNNLLRCVHTNPTPQCQISKDLFCCLRRVRSQMPLHCNNSLFILMLSNLFIQANILFRSQCNSLYLSNMYNISSHFLGKHRLRFRISCIHMAI